MEDEIGLSPVLAPKQKDAPKEEPAETSPVKTAPSGSARGTPSTSKSAKSKRKLNGEDAKASNSAPSKKVKTENVRLSFMNVLYFASSFYSNR
jgi:transcription initiation factor TFIIF subunit alpha